MVSQEEQALKERVLAKYAFFTEKIGQMSGNIERMEREGTTRMPALDSKSLDNKGKIQYEIDKTFRNNYSADKQELESKYMEFF